MNYIVPCRSGILALVDADSAADAAESWDEEAERGEAEHRGGTPWPASRGEVRQAVASGHDYR